MCASRELVDEFPRHILVFNDGDAWKVHIPTQGDVTKGSRQQFALEGISGSDYRHAGVECSDVLHWVALAVKRSEGGRFEILWDWCVPDFC